MTFDVRLGILKEEDAASCGCWLLVDFE